MLDLEQPIRAIEGRRNALDDLELESTRMEHAIYFEENRFPLKTLTSSWGTALCASVSP